MDDEAAAQTRAAFDAAASHFDHDVLSFFVRFGRRSAEHALLRPGDHVLDVACGSGSSLMPAAEMVGASGRVVGVDLSEGLLERARAKAERAGHDHVELRFGDMRELDFPSESFDAVLSVFGVFFVPEMEAMTRDLWALVKPDGRLVMTVWARGLMEPAHGAFRDAVRVERPDLVEEAPRWERISAPDDFRTMLCAAGIPEDAIEIVTVPGRHPLPAADDYWTIVMGTGLRGTIEQLSPDAADRVRRHVTDVLETTGTTELPVDVHHARDEATWLVEVA